MGEAEEICAVFLCIVASPFLELRLCSLWGFCWVVGCVGAHASAREQTCGLDSGGKAPDSESEQCLIEEICVAERDGRRVDLLSLAK